MRKTCFPFAQPQIQIPLRISMFVSFAIFDWDCRRRKVFIFICQKLVMYSQSLPWLDLALNHQIPFLSSPLQVSKSHQNDLRVYNLCHSEKSFLIRMCGDLSLEKQTSISRTNMNPTTEEILPEKVKEKLDSIVVSVFVVILFEFDKYWKILNQKQIKNNNLIMRQVEAAPDEIMYLW